MSAKHGEAERQRAALWLEQAAAGLVGRRTAITPAKVIWAAIQEAVEGVEAFPDRERRWLASGTRSASLIAAGLGRGEALQLEALRSSLSGVLDQAGPRVVPCRGRDEGFVLGVLGWFRYAERAREPKRLQRAAYLLARKGDVAAVAEIYAGGGRSRGRQVAYEVRTRLCGFIQAGLRDDLGVDLGPGGVVVCRSERNAHENAERR